MAEAADIVIVGAGATGLAFAWRLANLQPDLRILLVERGDFVNQRNAASKKNDWELALQKSFHANPNIRKSAADYPVDESQTPIKPAFFKVSNHRANQRQQAFLVFSHQLHKRISIQHLPIG